MTIDELLSEEARSGRKVIERTIRERLEAQGIGNPDFTWERVLPTTLRVSCAGLAPAETKFTHEQLADSWKQVDDGYVYVKIDELVAEITGDRRPPSRP
jgi:hypothetical protein